MAAKEVALGKAVDMVAVAMVVASPAVMTTVIAIVTATVAETRRRVVGVTVVARRGVAARSSANPARAVLRPHPAGRR